MTDNMTTARQYGAHVEREMRSILTPTRKALSSLYGMMQYHMGWVDETFSPDHSYPGKLVRPTILLLVCDAVGGDWKAALPAAAAVELLHNFSLIHDDIEDVSPTRRGRPTVWSLWGLAHAVNVGDIMYSYAYRAVSRLHGNGLSAETVHATLRLLNQACICLCEGQYLDLAFEGRVSVDMPLYLQMIEQKTASLIACAAEMGALIGGASPTVIQHYRRFGQQLGVGFQIMDDILGVWGDPTVTGKPTQDDLRARKKTFPVLHAMAVERDRGDSTLGDLYTEDEITDAQIDRMLEALEKAGSHQHATEVLADHRHKALQELRATGMHNAAQEALASLAASVLDRQY